MNIEDAIQRVAQTPEGTVLIAKTPLSWGAEAMFTELTDDYRLPQALKDAGYEYLLGRDDIVSLLVSLNKKKVSSRTAAEFIIYYAMNDSVPAWIDDIPDL